MTEDRYAEARALVIGAGKAACSFVQRKLHIGFNEAARYVERLEAEGFISAANECGVRKVLVFDLRHANEHAALAIAKARLKQAEREMELALQQMHRATQAMPAEGDAPC